MFQYDLDTMKEALLGRVEDMKDDVASLSEELNENIKEKIDYLLREVKARKDQLEALNPKKVLDRGYSISTSKDGRVIQSIKDISKGEEIITSVKDGTIISTVEKVEEE